mmetsp:Transcript_22331/g.40637  ORF Transcript_22331/g.40637 Transcript_22331/m.40637 type:complete len:899 (-) Transcript_22331:34-2730(-)
MSDDDFESFLSRQLEALHGCLVTEYRRQAFRINCGTEHCSIEAVEEAGSFCATSPSRGLPGVVAEPFGAPPALEYVPKEPRTHSPPAVIRDHGSLHDDDMHDIKMSSGLKVQDLDSKGKAAAADDFKADSTLETVDLTERPGVTWKKSVIGSAKEPDQVCKVSSSTSGHPRLHRQKTKERKSLGGESANFYEAHMARMSSQHQFATLPVWTSGLAGNRRFIYSMRSKSAFLEFKELKSMAIAESDWRGHKPYMIHPSSLTHLLWDVFGLLLIAYDCITIPMEVFDPEDNAFQITMTWLIRLYWTFNIAMSFLTGYLQDNGTVEMRADRVAKRYAMTWLPLDLFIVSLDWAEAAVDSFGSFQRFGTAMRSLRMVRTLRLVRLIKAPEITGFVNEHIRSEQVLLSATIVYHISLVLGVAHLIACAWYAMGRFSRSGPGEDTWIRRYSVKDMDMGQRYAVSFHWSLSMVAGELTHEPQNGSERIFTICVLFFAIIISATFVSSLTTALTHLRMITSQQSSNLSKLRRFLVDQSISRELAVRIQRNAQFSLLERAKNAPESSVELLKMISNPLLVEMHFEIHSHWIMAHPFFFLYHDVNPAGVRKVCHVAVSTGSLSKGDVLFHDLEVATNMRMYWITRGGIDYKQEDKEMVAVEKGTWLCEAVLWTSWTHCGTARANTECRLLVLDATKFQEIVGSFPSDHAAQYASEYVDLINSQGPINLSDLHMDGEAVDEVLERVFPEENDDDEDDECDVLDGTHSAEPEGKHILKVGGSLTATESRDSYGFMEARSGDFKSSPVRDCSFPPDVQTRTSLGSTRSRNSTASGRHSRGRGNSSSRGSRHSAKAGSKKQRVGFQFMGAIVRLSAPVRNRISSNSQTAANTTANTSVLSANRGSSNVVPLA